MTAITVDELAGPAAAPDAGIRRDRWGRYLLPHPATGKEQAWTRATTLAGTLADRYGLEQWSKRNVVLGIGVRQDLYAQAAACTPDDRDTLNQIVLQAEEAASSKAGANLGTALHRFTERVDAGELRVDQVPEPWRADVHAYVQAMTAAGVVVVPGWLERILIVPDIDVAGTCDRLVQLRRGTFRGPKRIADLKTGKDVIRYGMVEIALQLAIYAHATHWYDPTSRQLHPMPDVDQTKAIVMHAPVGQGTCQLIEVDIAAGWQAVQLAVDVRNWRKRKDLAQIITPAATRAQATGPSASPERVAWARGRVAAIVAAGHEPELAGLWDTTLIPAPLRADTALTDAQIDVLVGWCSGIEALAGLPFEPTDPNFAPFTPAEPAAPPPVEPPANEARLELARHWAERGRQLFEDHEIADDEPMVAAVISAAFMTGTETMTEALYQRLEALVSEIHNVKGAVILRFDDEGHPIIFPADDAEARMIAAAGSRGEAKERAVRIAKQAGRIAPRSLPKAAEIPLYAAMVAAGHGANNNTNKEQPAA